MSRADRAQWREARCGPGDEARAVARDVGRAYDHWTRDEETLLAASHRLATLIVKYECSA